MATLIWVKRMRFVEWESVVSLGANSLELQIIWKTASFRNL